eukprot:265612-Hanusia_phi.AAC.1
MPQFSRSLTQTRISSGQPPPRSARQCPDTVLFCWEGASRSDGPAARAGRPSVRVPVQRACPATVTEWRPCAAPGQAQ